MSQAAMRRRAGAESASSVVKPTGVAKKSTSHGTARMAMRMSKFVVLMLSMMLVSSGMAKGEEQGDEGVSNGVTVAISIMLLGSIGFQMSLFYLVNHRDEDMRRYSWQVISSTISIFCAVLLFQAFDGIVDCFTEDLDIGVKICIDSTHALCWFATMQIVLALATDAVKTVEPGVERKKTDEHERRVKCWATLTAHIAGFASLNAWGNIQHLAFFAYSPVLSFGVVPIAAASLILLFQVTDAVRERIAGSDGVKDECEELWDEETEEAEDDVFSLCISFLTQQGLRFLIGGYLPNSEGEEEPVHVHSQMQTMGLVTCALVYAALTVVVLQQRSKHAAAHAGHGEHEHEASILPSFTVMGKEIKGTLTWERVLGMAQAFCSMGFAWSLLYSAQWTMNSVSPVLKEGILGRVVVALVGSAVSFMIIFVLDKLADSDATSDETDKAIVNIILSLGIMIGFTWEQSFDAAVASIAGTTEHPVVWKFILAVLLAGIVLPAWYFYILPTVIEEEEKLKEKEEEAHAKAHGHSHGHAGHGEAASTPYKQLPC